MGNRSEAPDRRRMSERDWQKRLRRPSAYHTLSEHPAPYTPPDHKPVYYTGPDPDVNKQPPIQEVLFIWSLPVQTLLLLGYKPVLGMAEAVTSLAYLGVWYHRNINGVTLLPVPKLPRMKDLVDKVIKPRQK